MTKFMVSGAAALEFLLPFFALPQRIRYVEVHCSMVYSSVPFWTHETFQVYHGLVVVFWILLDSIPYFPSRIWSSRLYPQGCFHCISMSVACRNKCVNAKEDRPLVARLTPQIRVISYDSPSSISDLIWIRAYPSLPNLNISVSGWTPSRIYAGVWRVRNVCAIRITFLGG